MIPWLLLLLAADPGGYLAARWGMTPDQVLAAVAQAERNIGPDATRPFNGTLTPIIIKEIQIAGMPMRVHFRFGEKSGRLENVPVETVRDQDKTLGGFERIEALLVEKYGHPWASTSPDGRTSRWTFATTVIQLSYDQLRAIAFRSLCIVYRPRDLDPPI